MLNKLYSLLWGRSLEAYIISYNPLIIISFWHDFYNNKDEILKLIPKGENVYCFFKCGYYKGSEDAVKIREKMNVLQKRYPLLDYYVLANSPEELDNISKQNIKTVLVNHNTFLKEIRYPILPKVKKKYRAVYLAKFYAVKRHILARKISNLLLIGDYNPPDEPYFKKVMNNIPSETTWVRKVFTLLVPLYLNKAKVGLALSDKEGAMYSCTEYMLCGLPVVSTYNKGGRDVYLGKYAKTVSADADEVELAVGELIEQNYSPEDIRNYVIKILKIHRRRFIKLVNEIYSKNNIKRDFLQEWKKVFVHKMGLRCGILPWVYKNRILKVEQKKV